MNRYVRSDPNEAARNVKSYSNHRPVRTVLSLQRVAKTLRAGGPDEQAVASAIDRYLAGGAATLDDAFDLKRSAGDGDPRAQLARLHRDDLLRLAARKFFPDRSFRLQGEQVHRALSLYAAGRWRRDRLLRACPESYRGKLDELLWTILSARDLVLSARAIRRILVGHEVGDFMANAPRYTDSAT